MKPDVLAQSQLRQCDNVIDDAVGKVGRRADEENRVRVDQARHGSDVNLVIGRRTLDQMNLHLEVLRRLVESRMRRLGEDAYRKLVACLGLDVCHLHLRFRHSALMIRPLARGQACHEDAVGASAGGRASCVGRRVEHAQDHAHHLGFHLAHSGKHVGVDGVRHSELAKRLGLQLEELVLAVVDGTRDAPILPSNVIHVGECFELGANGIVGKAFLG